MSSMKYRRLSRLTDYERADGERHPMLLHGAGIATIAAGCTSAAAALAMSAVMLVLCCAMSVVYMLERGEYRQPMRSVVYWVPSVLLAFGCGALLCAAAPGTAAGLGIYLPVAAADTLVLSRLQPGAPFVAPAEALPDALRLWWLYAVMALPIGGLREIIGSGTLFGVTVFFKTGAQGMTLPFAGLILLGFGLAIYQKRYGSGR